ncbi:hypothetical protein HII12_004141 [Brettanomyces bruxellensis]|uniref:UBX domain-containing protein n=1 Tax=Dekkera bruxellensis TaxID=5007 RepID=A0A8H6ESD0_DEKBR|nr:hypothetical protein HII12_004141 [Brettanomyces bruxellensis]
MAETTNSNKTKVGELTFSTDASSAIQKSLQLQKPLLMLICEENEVSNKWIAARFGVENTRFATEFRDKFSESYVLLKIAKNTPNFSLLTQIYPQFATIQVPAAMIVFKGKIVETLSNDLSVDQFNDKVGKLAGQFGKEGVSKESEHKQEAAAGSRPGPVHKRRYSSLKEEGAEIAREQYRANMMKFQKEEEEEKERILRLVRMDRQQQKHEERIEKGEEQEKPIRENLHNEELEKEPDYMLQIRMPDGKSFRQSFGRDEELFKVREAVLERYPDYRNTTFHFYKSIERVTYRDEDEQKSLTELNLNRSTLFVKPVEAFERRRGEGSANMQREAGGSVAGTFNWLKDTIGSYIWGDGRAGSPIIRHSEAEYHDDEREKKDEDKPARFDGGNGTEVEGPRK